ncbi:rod shape-determining protein MreC [Marinobacterium arenosum]|uniref:rod shape-determining protein MreC n=1 Tax=Marinobacterium arenosum TaxID=2862496 RepID=UPI0028F439B8|nr:rod shape-determining protein MreC [Marinobacterium arenosum]
MGRCPIKTIFRGRSPGYSFLFLLLLAVALIVADLYTAQMRQGRAYLSLLITPLQWLVDIPSRAAGEVSDLVVDRRLLLKENEQLRADALLLERKVQHVAALTAENVRLRELLNGRARIDEQVMLAELIGVNPDPFQHQVIVNRGLEDGVYEGQPVLDAGGVMGQVVESTHYTSRVVMITDARHAIPVEVNRNGVRSIALGTGEMDELVLDHVADTADIREGDLLVTSGLGGRFPRGYPVAEVSKVVRDPGQPFASVRAVPTARMDKSRHLLLVTMPQPLILAADPAEARPAGSQAGVVKPDSSQTDAARPEATDGH